MPEIKLLIVHPMDIMGRKIGGIETFVRTLIKYAPENFDIDFVGITTDNDRRPVGVRQEIVCKGHKISFLPLMSVKDENKRPLIPLSLKFVIRLFLNICKIEYKKRVFLFNRIESILPFRLFRNKRMLVIHTETRDMLRNPNSEVKWKYFTWLYILYEKSIIGNVDKVFVVREDTTDYYKKLYPAMKTRFAFLPTWFDKETFFPADPSDKTAVKKEFCQSLNIPPQYKLVLFAGRLESVKNPSLLIDIFRHINQEAKDTCMIIVGAGACEAKMRKTAEEYGLSDAVRFLGAKGTSDTARIMRTCDILLLASAFEGMPRSILESLASGIPVVTTDVGECRRVVIDDFSGYVSKQYDAKKLADLALRILGNPDKFSASNCVKAVSEYTAENILKDVYNVFRELTVKQ